MVSVATDNLPCVLMHQFAELRVLVPVLPSRCRHDDEEAQFVAGIHESRVLRIVGSSDDGHAGILQTLCVAPLLIVRHGIAHVGEVLMTVAADELVIWFAVEPESVLAAALGIAYSHAHDAAVYRFSSIFHAYLYII